MEEVNGDVLVCKSVVRSFQKIANASGFEKGRNLPLLMHVIWWGS